MSSAQQEYERLSQQLVAEPGVSTGQMFGKPCIKINGKAFVAHHKETVVFKLTDPQHREALAASGAVLWDPSGKGRPMKEWVALQAESAPAFKAYARAALAYVSQQG